MAQCGQAQVEITTRHSPGRGGDEVFTRGGGGGDVKVEGGCGLGVHGGGRGGWRVCADVVVLTYTLDQCPKP